MGGVNDSVYLVVLIIMNSSSEWVSVAAIVHVVKGLACSSVLLWITSCCLSEDVGKLKQEVNVVGEGMYFFFILLGMNQPDPPSRRYCYFYARGGRVL